MPSYPGRPREFTYARRRELTDHIGQGATLEEAARIVGVSLRTVQREARHNEFFHHDLQLALHGAPADPYKLVARAARTHWRAAAWLLERTDPDRFARRPPNSCRPETLREFGAWLIETALETTPPEQREAVYRRMSAVADKAFAVVMPDQHDARRSLVGALPDRPLPLSDHEVAKELLAGKGRTAPALGLPQRGEGCLPPALSADELLAEATNELLEELQLDPLAALQSTADPAASLTPAPIAEPIADPIAYYRRHPPQAPPAGRPREGMNGFRFQDSESMDAEWRHPSPEEEDGDAEADGVHRVAGVESASPQPSDLWAANTPTPATALSAETTPGPAGSPERGNYVAKNARDDKSRAWPEQQRDSPERGNPPTNRRGRRAAPATGRRARAKTSRPKRHRRGRRR